MGSLEVTATPLFGKKDHDWLVHLRQARAQNLGPPHFTLVFPGADLEQHDFAQRVKAAAARVTRISFTLRSALAAPDPQVRAHHVFLVPDEGFGAIVRLHETLHAGPLKVCLRADFPYIPHLTVSTERDVDTARRIAASLNAKDIAIAGRSTHSKSIGATARSCAASRKCRSPGPVCSAERVKMSRLVTTAAARR